MSIGMVSNPGLLSISSSWVVKDDTTGLVYLDTVTTSIGRMVLGSTESGRGPTIEDITDPVIRTSSKSAIRWKGTVTPLHTAELL